MEPTKDTTIPPFRHVEFISNITIEEIPAGTLMRVTRDIRKITLTDPNTKEQTIVEEVMGEKKEALFNRTKEEIVAEIDAQIVQVAAEKTAEVAKLDAIKSELSK